MRLPAALTTWAICLACLCSCSPKTGPHQAGMEAKVDYAAVKSAVAAMLPEIRRHVQTMASFGPRQTGQEGCDKSYRYIRQQLAQAAPGIEVREFVGATVAVPLDRLAVDSADAFTPRHTHILLHGRSGAAPTFLPAYSLMPNCVQACTTHNSADCPLHAAGGEGCPNCERPHELVDLGSGTWSDLAGKDLTGKVVLLDFNSGDAWLKAASLGAYGAIFTQPDFTTLFQADKKYLATMPLHFPRLYVLPDQAQSLRKALDGGGTVEVTLANRLAFRNVPAPCLELTIPGRDRGYAMVLAAHFDARGIVPDLAYGASELWSAAQLLEVTRYYAAHQPQCDLRILFVSGLWQDQRTMRDYIAPGGPIFDRAGTFFKAAFSFDMAPQGRSINLLNETAWDQASVTTYAWLGMNMFGEGGWRDQIFQGLNLPSDITIYGGSRPLTADTLDEPLACRNDRSPFIYTPRFPTAEQAFQCLGMPTVAFQTQRLIRMTHNTPLDRCENRGAAEVDDSLRPQLEVALATMNHILAYPKAGLPSAKPELRAGPTYGGFTRIRGHVQQWDRAIGWFAQRLPGYKAATTDVPAGRPANAPRTFLFGYAVDRYYNSVIGPRLRDFYAYPQAPSLGRTRDMQSFLFHDLLLLETPQYCLNAVYSAWPTSQYNVLGYSIDPASRLVCATDFGTHGDGDKAFQCTNLDLDTWDMHVPVSLFDCGCIELLGLLDAQRYNATGEIFGSVYQNYMPGQADRGLAPFIRVSGVKDTESHTDLERWGFSQAGPYCMTFLPAGSSTPAEILLGGLFTNFGLLNNPAGDGKAQGYRLEAGESIRLAGTSQPTPRRIYSQLATLDGSRIRQFARYDVTSPLANREHAQAQAIAAQAQAASAQGDLHKAAADDIRSWTSESKTYREVLSLLLDVVSTTVLFFVLLLPFSFLMERLVFPQRTALRTGVVATVVFALFAGLLYHFHPGFKLANNVIVTTTAFLIVVMTAPALVLLLVRGTAMLRAIGSKAVITQQSEAESAGVVTAALSLAVSNMRRRKLRTALTLGTITILVLSLVLLTTSSAFDFRILEPASGQAGGYNGLQVFNARERRQPLLSQMVDVVQGAFGDQVLILPREGVSYGYDHLINNGSLLLRRGQREVRVPYFQIMDERDNLPAYSLPRDGGEVKVHLSDLMTQGRFLEKDDVDVCLLPDNMASALEAKVGDTVTVMGMPLRVAGIWRSQRPSGDSAIMLPGDLDRLCDLDGLPITTLRTAMIRQGDSDAPVHAPSSEIVILPRKWIQKYQVFPTLVFSLVLVPPEGPGQAEAISSWAELLSKELINTDIFIQSADPSGRTISSRLSMHTATQVKGSSMMIVVVGVAVMMILAIMIGTVYERMREIHIFSSVGLSPRHVAGIFLIEAIVYAGIASVLGYFLGIVALKGLMYYLKSTGQAQDFYPNYLGVFVLYSIGVAVLATVASSLYPIHLAGKIINPSQGKLWQLHGDADEMAWQIRLPFIATTWNETLALMDYAYEYLAIHQGQRSGRFVCLAPPGGARTDREVTLRAPLWLAPFERNLTQQVVIVARPTPDGAWWELSLDLTRLSGPGYLWHRGARVFVDMLCKHLLRWRAVTGAQEQECLERAGNIFTPPPGPSDEAET